MGFSVTKDGNAAQRWPDGVLRYTIEDEDKDLAEVFEEAWLQWDERISVTKDKIDWDPNGFHGDLLVVSRSEKETKTTVGYLVNPHDEQKLKFNLNHPGGHGNSISNMIHEIGHALGLYHEHQRPDADHNIKVKCSNLADYQDVKKRVGGRMGQLCQDVLQAKRENFSAGDILPYPEQATWAAYGGFDWESIMMYCSEFGAKRKFLSEKKKRVMKKKDSNEAFVANNRPSGGDVECVNNLYAE